MINKFDNPELEIKHLEKEQERLTSEISELAEWLYGPFDEDPFDHEEYLIQQNQRTEEFELQELEKQLSSTQERLGNLRRNVFLEKNLINIVENSTKGVESDSLNRDSLAKSLANLINEEEQDSNLSIGILGKWGSGKTTFLNMIKSNLKTTDTVISFDASQYDDQEQIWYSLLSSVSNKYLSSGNEFLQKSRFIFKTLKEKKEYSIVYIPLVLSLALVVLLTFLIMSIKDFSQTNHLLQSFLAVISTGVGYIALESIKKSYKSLEKYFVSGNEQLLKQLKYPNYRELLGTRENVRTELTTFKNLILARDTGLKNIVIIIDELDRCSEKTIKNFFSSIEAFIDIPGIIFIFSFNADIVYPAVAKIPKGESEENLNIKIGVEFVEKYINLFFTLPSVISYKEYIKSLLNNIVSDEDISLLTQLIDYTSNVKDISPREVKKLLDLSLIYHKEFTNFSYSEFSVILILQYYYSIFDELEIGQLKSTQFSNISIYRLKEVLKTTYSDEIIKLIIELLPNININTIVINIKEINNILKYTK